MTVTFNDCSTARSPLQASRARLIAPAHERRQWLGDGCATETSRAVHKLLQRANLRAEVVAVASHRFSDNR